MFLEISLSGTCQFREQKDAKSVSEECEEPSQWNIVFGLVFPNGWVPSTASGIILHVKTHCKSVI